MNALVTACLRKRFRFVPALFLLPGILRAQPLPVRVVSDPVHRTVTVTAGGEPFTTFSYPDTLEKPVLYPIYASDGRLITRGFPLNPRQGEPVDHPHHIGLWFNYENVNGLDFWNNSYAIPAEKKSLYGWIRTDTVYAAVVSDYSAGNFSDRVDSARQPQNTGVLTYTARWTDRQRHVLLREKTVFTFHANAGVRIIDRSTTLTAVADTGVSFPDAKDGLLGLRVAKELQIPSDTPGQFVDAKGNVTKVAAGNTPDINGNYLTGEGKAGDSAWGTRARWCLLYGRMGADTISVVIIDHPANPGYPTYWHARGYGLFAANPLGQKVFSKGKENLNFRLARGQSATFRYRVVIAAGPQRLSTYAIRRFADGFARLR